MKLNKFCVLFLIIIAPNMFSINLSFFDINHVSSYRELSFVPAFADNNDNSTIGTETDTTTLNANPVEGQCDPADPSCTGGGNDGGQCDPADPSCTGGGNDGGQCDPVDPSWTGGGNDGGQCDPADPSWHGRR